MTWNRVRDEAIHLFGHVHPNWRGAREQVNVGVDLWDFRSVTVTEAELQALMLPPLKLHAPSKAVRPGLPTRRQLMTKVTFCHEWKLSA